MKGKLTTWSKTILFITRVKEMTIDYKINDKVATLFYYVGMDIGYKYYIVMLTSVRIWMGGYM